MIKPSLKIFENVHSFTLKMFVFNGTLEFAYYVVMNLKCIYLGE